MTAREDFREILRLVRPGSRVLDVGCGEGELLELMAREKGVHGRGLEISPEGVSACMARGLAVVQGDADDDLDYFPAKAFDYAVLSQTLRRCASHGTCSPNCCASPTGPSSPCPTSAIGASGSTC